jgi:phosphohistidine phosphatase
VILYFLRHAHAVDAVGLSDEERALNDKGNAQAEATAKLFKRLDLQVDALYCSPRLRCRQTAEIVGRAFNAVPDVREELNFGFNVTLLNDLLADLNFDQNVMLVGHEPTFSRAVQDLTGARVEMKKCGLARVDLISRTPLQGELIWLVAPRLVRALVER